jgi:hypothetical protein
VLQIGRNYEVFVFIRATFEVGLYREYSKVWYFFLILVLAFRYILYTWNLQITTSYLDTTMNLVGRSVQMLLCLGSSNASHQSTVVDTRVSDVMVIGASM